MGRRESRVNEAIRLSQEHTHTESRVVAAHFSTHLHQLRAEVTATRERAETLIALADEYALELWKSVGVINRGWAMAEQGDLEGGIEQMRRGLSSYQATGGRLWRPHFLGLLAGALAKKGRLDEALAAVTEALIATGDTGELYSQAELYRIKGELLIMRVSGDQEARVAQLAAPTPRAASLLSEAEECFERAVAVARGEQSKAWELRAVMSMARLYRRQGKRARAREFIRKSLGKFTEGFDTADLRDARTLHEQ